MRVHYKVGEGSVRWGVQGTVGEYRAGRGVQDTVG